MTLGGGRTIEVLASYSQLFSSRRMLCEAHRASTVTWKIDVLYTLGFEDEGTSDVHKISVRESGCTGEDPPPQGEISVP